MSEKPTLVFVPGSWHHTDTWDRVVSILEVEQHKCVRVALPSTLSDPAVTLADDVKAARDLIVGETSVGHNVVVVVHSYGGFVGSSAVKGLTRPKQGGSSVTKDGSGHVIGMVMLASGFAQTGVSFIDGAGGKPPPSWKADTESGYATILADPRQLFYHDLKIDDGEFWVSKLTKQSLKALMEGGEAAYAGWMEVPVWYLSTTADQALPIEAQRIFVQAAKEAGGDVTLWEVESSHSPMLSKPEETAKFVLEAVVAFTG